MLNSQFPYNQLPKLQDINLKIDDVLETACKVCWKSLYHLHGYIDAYTPENLHDDLLLLQISDAKYSFDLEGESVSATRLFEAYSSENFQNDEIATMIFNYISYCKLTDHISINNLKPVYFHSYKRTQDLLRDRKEIQIKSFHTNLTLYTAPVQQSTMRILKDELEFQLHKTPSEDELIRMSLCHVQLRAVAPYTYLNQHVARTYTQLWLKSMHLNYQFLPIGRIISDSRETYQLMMRDIANKQSYEAWCLYFIEVMSSASAFMLERLKSIQVIRKNTMDIMTKYTDYALPAQEIMPVIFSRPYIKPKYLIDAMACHRQTAYTYLAHLVRSGILVEKKSGREKLYLHKQLFDVLSN